MVHGSLRPQTGKDAEFKTLLQMLQCGWCERKREQAQVCGSLQGAAAVAFSPPGGFYPVSYLREIGERKDVFGGGPWTRFCSRPKLLCTSYKLSMLS